MYRGRTLVTTLEEWHCILQKFDDAKKEQIIEVKDGLDMLCGNEKRDWGEEYWLR